MNFPDLRADYDFWRLPQVDDGAPDSPPGDDGGDYSFIRHRPVFVAGPAGSLTDPAGKPLSPNLAGRLAADFALYHQLYRTTDPKLAAQALADAEHVFAQADTSYADPATDDRPLLTIVPFDGYPESVWDDDMELGATELYFATGARRYLAAATHFAARYNGLAAGDKDTLNLYDVGGLANFELYRALGMAGSPGGLETTRAALARALKAQLDAAVATAGGDAWGFGRDWRSGDTTSHGDGLAVTADEVDAVRGDKAYDGYARNWLANVLGANPWGVSLIIGDGSTWTNCPQQQPANLLGSLTGGSPELWGAAVEGPTAEATSGGYDTMRPCPPGGGDAYATFDGNDGAFAVAKRAVYTDNVESYSTTEPAIDLTASSFLMFSWRQNGHPDDWTSTAAAALPGPASAHASFRVGATVTSTGADAPGGNVRFLLGGTGGRLLGQATLLRGPRSTSIAALRIPASALAPGANRIVAYYPGARGSQGPSTSLPVRLRVERG